MFNVIMCIINCLFEVLSQGTSAGAESYTSRTLLNGSHCKFYCRDYQSLWL